MKNPVLQAPEQPQNCVIFRHDPAPVIHESSPLRPVLLDLHDQHAHAWAALAAEVVQSQGVTGFHLSEPPSPALVALLGPQGALGWSRLSVSEALARRADVQALAATRAPDAVQVVCTALDGDTPTPPRLWRPEHLPPLDASGALETLLSTLLSAPGARLCISLHLALAQLLSEGWSMAGACTELTERVQALPAHCLGLLELGGYQHWPSGVDLRHTPADHRVPAALWTVLEALAATGHAPAIRLAWERDVPGLAVMLDEARQARALLA